MDPFPTVEAARSHVTRYYSRIEGRANSAIVRWHRDLVGTLSGIRALDYGCGPTLYPALASCWVAESIHLADRSQGTHVYLNEFLDGYHEEPWLTWAAELHPRIEPALTVERTREIIVLHSVQHPADLDPERFDLVCCNFVFDSEVTVRDDWRKAHRELVHLLRPNGIYSTLALAHGTTWESDVGCMSNTYLDSEDIACLALDLGLEVVHDECLLADRVGGEGFLYLMGRKRL